MRAYAVTFSPPRRSLPAFGLVASVLLHGAIWAWLVSSTSLPDLDLQFVVPIDMQFGVEAPSPPPPPPPPPPTPAEAQAPEPEAPAAPAPSDAISVDPPRPRRPRRPRPPREETPAPAPAVESFALAPSALAAEASDLAAFAPPGAQIALRVDFTRLRGAPLEPSVRTLLAAVPDWQFLLDGSGIDALADLDRLMIATPDLRREHIVLSGQYSGDRTKVDAAIASLATARGEEAAWRTENGVEVAPWWNRDETERVVAIVGAREFAIVRSDDLPRVLAVASVRAARAAERARAEQASASARPPEPEAHPPAAEGTAAGTEAPAPTEAPLLSMRENEVLAVDVENARAFVRGAAELVPNALQISVTQVDATDDLRVHIDGFFESADAAEVARQRWDRLREQFMRNAFVALAGVGSVLQSMRITAPGEHLVVEATVGLGPARMMLAFAQSWFTNGRALPRAPDLRVTPVPSGAPGTQPPAPSTTTTTTPTQNGAAP